MRGPEHDKRRPRPGSGVATKLTGASLLADRPVERVLGRLEKVRRTPRGWSSRCPAHDDRWPSLSIAEGADGKAILCCHAGCSAGEIVGALGLELRDLFQPRHDFRPAPRRKPKPIPRDTLHALAWRRAFTFEWKVATLLAPLPAALAQRDLLSVWDWLNEHGCDPAFTWRVACLIRGVALLNYSTTGDAGDVARAVRRLLREVDSDVAVVA